MTRAVICFAPHFKISPRTKCIANIRSTNSHHRRVPSSLPPFPSSSIRVNKAVKQREKRPEQRLHQHIVAPEPHPHTRYRDSVDARVRFRDVDEYLENFDRFGRVGDEGRGIVGRGRDGRDGGREG